MLRNRYSQDAPQEIFGGVVNLKSTMRIEAVCTFTTLHAYAQLDNAGLHSVELNATAGKSETTILTAMENDSRARYWQTKLKSTFKNHAYFWRTQNTAS
jgi:hypothetical protein